MARTLKDYPQISLKPENLDGKIDFVRLFGRSGPVHVEIGSGKGTFLVSEAQSLPEDNFLGIEWAGRYYRYAVDRIGRWGLTNVRIIRTDAAAFFVPRSAFCILRKESVGPRSTQHAARRTPNAHVPDESVDCFHIYFPDPWHKKRHHKRRLICPANMENFIRCLKTGGQIRIATDHADYFEQIKNVIAGESERLEEIDFVRPSGAQEGELAGTNFERKYIKDQRSIYTIAVRKR